MKTSKWKFLGFTKTIDDKDGRPAGIIWLTACFLYKNYRLFPIGWRK